MLEGYHAVMHIDSADKALLLAEMRRLDGPYRLWSQPDDGLPNIEKKALKGR
jgi:hypothetical protein